MGGKDAARQMGNKAVLEMKLKLLISKIRIWLRQELMVPSVGPFCLCSGTSLC